MTRSHGTGLPPWTFRKIGDGVVFEHGVLVFHPENIILGSEIYVGHYAIIKGYFRNCMTIGNRTWIGQHCLLHSAGGLEIGNDVGIGPGVRILTSSHDLATNVGTPIVSRPIKFSPVIIGDGCDIGVNSVILPGVTLGERVQIGAGAVVTKSLPSDCIAIGIPARPVS